MDLLLALLVAHEQAWDANWQATAVAYDAMRQAHREAVEAEQAWRICRPRSVPPVSLSCDCGECGPALVAAAEALELARAEHAETVIAFKAGVTAEQLEALVEEVA